MIGQARALLARLGLYLRTASTLQPSQLFYWPLRRIQAHIPPRIPNDREPLAKDRLDRLARVVGEWGPPDEEFVARADSIGERRFTFLNHTEVLEGIDWEREYHTRLWTYHLHYFNYVLDLAWSYRSTGKQSYLTILEDLLRDWIEATRSSTGPGWEPYPLAVRVANWSYVDLLIGSEITPDLREQVLQSIFAQAHVLSRRLERHLGANHLLKDLRALVVAGLMFDGPEARRWLRIGMREVWRETEDQFLSDGVHYERSPMYHLEAVADLLELMGLLVAARRSVPERIGEKLDRAVAASGVLCREDGTLHQFNDSVRIGPASRDRVDRLSRFVRGKAIPVARDLQSLPDAGYYAYVNSRTGERLLFDSGPPGPVSQPGHAHCDLLSFEFDFKHQPVVVDSGVCGYGGDRLRAYVRSTRAHNTVMIDGCEQSEIWSTFRMARRAVPVEAGLEGDEEECRFTGAYRPFHDRRILHRRRILRNGPGDWRIEDSVRGSEGKPVASFLHLHPDFIVSSGGGQADARSSSLSLAIRPYGIAKIVVVRGRDRSPQGWYCPDFGVAIAAPALVMAVDRGNEGNFGYRLRVEAV